ncbi:lipase secretion chaperone [Haliangium sp.]|uniref:lipase secretion chaperone n=1 Tax=Haliangium sp. TaxID=2663208 RepID=UPI003D0DE66C
MARPGNMRLALASAVAAALVAVGAWWWLGAAAPAPVTATASTGVEPVAPRTRPRAASVQVSETASGSGAAADQVDPALVERLQEEYGGHIEHAYMQMRLVEALMRYFQARFPDDWEDRLRAAVRAAFPEFADEIEALLAARIEYEAWMDSHRNELQGLDATAQREALRQTRERLFGAEVADEIWAAERKNRAVSDALAAIDADSEASLQDKLAMYRDSLEDIYGPEDVGEGAVSKLARHRHEAMTSFIGLNSVQRALGELPADARRRELRAIREGMGLDEEALTRWDQLDQKRDQRWEHGAAYMAERAALIERHGGAAPENELHALRVRYFDDEAETIRAEEAAGLFRFDRERRWGLN